MQYMNQHHTALETLYEGDGDDVSIDQGEGEDVLEIAPNGITNVSTIPFYIIAFGSRIQTCKV
jgi:hypothetical protein